MKVEKGQIYKSGNLGYVEVIRIEPWNNTNFKIAKLKNLDLDEIKQNRLNHPNEGIGLNNNCEMNFPDNWQFIKDPNIKCERCRIK